EQYPALGAAWPALGAAGRAIMCPPSIAWAQGCTLLGSKAPQSRKIPKISPSAPQACHGSF
ncbi:hypothetical protein A2U01_0105004, partial [Trifolium medium]|nr:hypothetical protein [Trifolium medium]